jgi:16S rRNA (guanine966-N2)-methyltransferase
MKSRMKKTKIDGKIKKPEIRITTGIAKNKRLTAPAIDGFRAVQEVAKSSVFSILGEKIVGAVCLDLFAGSGNMGLEALSRGAEWCDFVDDNYFSCEVIKENIINCGFLEKAEVTRKEAAKYVVNTEKTYDIVFLDPFYQDVAHKFLVSNLKNILNEEGIIVFFHGENLDLKTLVEGSGLNIMEERKFGKSFYTLLSGQL